LAGSARISYRQSQSIACTTGISDTQTAPDAVMIFPNPFSSSLTLELIEVPINTVNIYNVMMQNAGEYVFAGDSSKVTIDFSSLKNGIYFIKINHRHWGKILKDSSQK